MCDHVIRWVPAQGAPESTAMCGREPGHPGRHRTATAIEARRRHRLTYRATERGKVLLAARQRRKYHGNDAYRARDIARSTKWRADHPFRVAVLNLKYHSTAIAARLEEIA